MWCFGCRDANQLKWKRKILTCSPYIAFLWSRPLREVGELLKATDTDGFYNPFSTHTPAIMWTLLFPRQTVIAGALNSRVGGTMGNRCHWLISSSLRPGLGRNNPRDSQIYIWALHSYWKLFAFSSRLRCEASLYHRLDGPVSAAHFLQWISPVRPTPYITMLSKHESAPES